MVAEGLCMPCTCRPRRFKALATIGLVAAMVLWGALLTPASHATVTVSVYTRSGAGCAGGAVDPLNVNWLTFHSTKSIVKRATDATHWGLNWKDSAGSIQSMWTTNHVCQQQNTQRNLGFFEKHHLRVFLSHETNATAGKWHAQSDAHREYLTKTGCKKKVGPVNVPFPGHVVYSRINGRSGFQQGAYEVVHTLINKGVVWRNTVNRGVTPSFKQCNGQVAIWDGRQHELMFNHPAWP
jgi:hypothetical protein